MSPVTADARHRRIIQLSQQWGLVLPPAPTKLSRPQQPPTFRTPSDDATAESLLQRRSAEVAQLRPKSGLSRAFSSGNLKKGKGSDPKDILIVLNALVDSCGSPGVAEALIAKLAAAGVDLGGMQAHKLGILNRRRSLEYGVDRTRLLRSAIDNGHLEMVQILAPHADPMTLDTCLPVAIRSRKTQIVEILLRYNANASQTAEGQDEFRKACAIPALSDLVALLLQSDGRPSSVCVSQAMTDATRAQCLANVLHLSRSTADGNYNNAEALKLTITNERRDIAIAIVMGNKPPQSPGLEEAFQILIEEPTLSPKTKLDFAELILCCGAQGPILAQSLEIACETQFFEMADLLASYGASVEHNDASALKTAVSKGQANLVRSLLSGNSSVSPALASNCISLIPQQATFATRSTLLHILLKKGANGTALDECLVQAAKSGDSQSVELLLTPHFHEQPNPQQASRGPKTHRISNRHAVASPDYQNGEALRTAVLRGDMIMTATILAGRPSNETLASVFPLVGSLPPEDRYRIMELFLKSALAGPPLHSALQEAIQEDPHSRDDALIKLLLKYNADINYYNGLGLKTLILRKDIKLLSLLMQKASPQTAAARVSDAMELTDHRVRFDVMTMLFGAGAAVGVEKVTSVLLETLSEKVVDMSLLHLILERGKADINGLNGAILQKAVHNPDHKVLDMILGLGRHTAETIPSCLNELGTTPCTDLKAKKLDVILSKATQKPDLNRLLVTEVQMLAQDKTHRSSTTTLQRLLENGADPNSSHSRSLCSAVAAANTPLIDLLFKCQKPLTADSLSRALPHALSISDPMDRLALTKKLVDAGAFPREANRALNHAISTHTTDINLISVLANVADTSDGEALTLAVAKEAPDILDLLLSRTKHTAELRSTCLEKAMQITDWTPRLAMCTSLAMAGVSAVAASEALLIAARDGDLKLGDILITHGASILTNNGQAIIEACRGGSVEVLDVLLKSNLDTQKLTLERGFQTATEVRDLNKRAMIFERLLKRGVSGEVVDVELISAAKYGEAGKEVMRVLLAAGADPNYNDGRAVVAATEIAYIENLEMLLGLRQLSGNEVSRRSHRCGRVANASFQKKASPTTMIKSLKKSWRLSRDVRLHIIGDLLKAGLPITEDIHIALSKAVSEEDPDQRLIKLLLDSGASPLTNGCQTLLRAVQGAQSESLKLLLDRDITNQDLNYVFSIAFVAQNFSTWFSPGGLEISKMLLQKGAKGEALSGPLVQVMQNSTEDTEALADEFVDVFVTYGVDVNFEDGEPLVQAAAKANPSWTKKLLACHPSTEALSRAFENVFDVARSPKEVISLFELFSDHHEGGARLDVMSRRPGSEPLLFKAISQYPRSLDVLQTLLNAGYYHDQTTMYSIHPNIDEPEEVTVLVWAIAQPEKNVSTALIRELIDRDGK